jgi:3-dehydroquinate dehydratase
MLKRSIKLGGQNSEKNAKIKEIITSVRRALFTLRKKHEVEYTALKEELKEDLLNELRKNIQ